MRLRFGKARGRKLNAASSTAKKIGAVMVKRELQIYWLTRLWQGFDGVDAGGLDDSWRQQPGTPVYGADLDAEGVRRALSEAKRDRAPELRGTAKNSVVS